MSDLNRYTVRYRNHEGVKVELCVKAEHITEAIEAARSDSISNGCNFQILYNIITFFMLWYITPEIQNIVC